MLFTLINYLGTVIGVISVLFIYPKNKAFLGTVRYIDNIAQLLYPVMVLGASQALIKYYPQLTEKYKQQLFGYSMLSVIVISFIILGCIPLFLFFTDYGNSALLYFAFPVAVSLAFVELFKKQAQDLQKIAIPTFFEKLIPKIVLPILFILLLNYVLDVYTSLYFYVAGYLLIFILTALYLFRNFQPKFNFRFTALFTQIQRKDYMRYSLYAFAGSLGSLLAFRIDGIIIPELISLEANGSFSIGVTLASTLQIPAVGMFAIYAPIVSKSVKENNMTTLNRNYKQVAKVLFFTGAVLYSCIVLGIHDLFSLLPTSESLQASIPVIIILGLSVLFNMATSFNSEIITYSKYYRFNLIAVGLLTILNITLNLWFIYYTNLGIAGVAYASLVSMTLFNCSKLLFIYKKFGLFPFDKNFLLLAIIFVVSGVVIYFLPDADSGLMNLIYKTGLSLVVNVTAVYKLKLVFQVNEWVDKALKIIRLK